MAKEYTEPSWSGKPPVENPFNLDVLKNGVILENIQLLGQKSFYVIGRQPDIVDILAEHPSISRQHAVFQFRDDGALMCLDLESAQGTFVNKTPCPPGIYQRLYVGDIVRFGVSTRSYIINGPESQMLEEYDSENLQNYRRKLVNRSAEAEKAKKEKEAAGVTWGFSEDAPNEDFEDDDGDDDTELPSYIKDDKNFSRKFGEKYSAGIQDTEVNEKDKALLERLRGKELKIKNMQEENRRIYMKEASQENGLTEGQSAAVSRNDTRIEVLKEEIEALIEEIRTKKSQRDGGKLSSDPEKTVRSKSTVSERDDDLLDTTSETADASTNWRLRRKLAKSNQNLKNIQSVDSTVSLSYEELFAAKETQEAKIKDIRIKIAEVESRQGVGADESNDDGDIDGLLASERAREAAAKLRQLRTSESEAVADLGKISRLVKAATPALLSLASRPAASLVTPVISLISSSDSSNDQQSTTREAPITVATSFVKAQKESSTVLAKDVPMDLALPPAGEDKGGNHLVGAVKFAGDSVLEAYAPDASCMEQASCGSSGIAGDSKVVVDAIPAEIKSTGRPLGGKRPRAEKESYGSLSAIVKSNRIDHAAKEEKESETSFDNSSSSSSSKPGNSEEFRIANDSKQAAHSFPVAADTSELSAAAPSSKKRVAGPSRPQTASAGDAAPNLDPGMLQGGEKVWVPPKNQTGDGRTTLNIRLGY